MSKNVVIISPAHPYRGGQALVEAHIHRTLTDNGYDCNTVSFKLLYPKIFFPGRTQYDISNHSFLKHRQHIKRIINSIDPLSWNKSVRHISKLKPDVVLFVWWTPFLGPAYSWIINGLRKHCDAKIGFVVENYISHEKRWFDHYWSKKTLDKADFFISHSKYIGKCIKENHEAKLYTTTLPVYHLFDLDQWDSLSAKKQLGLQSGKVILYFGLIRHYKGLDRLLHSFETIMKDHPETWLLIAGEFYDDPAKYDEIIVSHPYADRIKLVADFIPNEEVEMYFKACDVVCLPYRNASQSGIQMIAYGFGKPVVITNVGGLSETVIDGVTGAIAPENSIAGITDALTRTLSDLDKVDFAKNIQDYIDGIGYQHLPGIMEKIMMDET